MARKKIVLEEEVSKSAMAEETTAANVDDAAPADLRPGSNAEESATLEAVPTETSLEGINENDTEEPARRKSQRVLQQRKPRKKQCRQRPLLPRRRNCP